MVDKGGGAKLTSRGKSDTFNLHQQLMNSVRIPTMPKLIVVDLVEFRPEIIVLTLATGLFFSSMFVCMTPIFTISMSVNEPADQECLFGVTSPPNSIRGP